MSARVLAFVGLGVLVAGTLAAQQAKPDTAKHDSTGGVTLVREVYAYEGGGRDPFMSLLKSGDIRPMIRI